MELLLVSLGNRDDLKLQNILKLGLNLVDDLAIDLLQIATVWRQYAVSVEDLQTFS